MKKKTPFLDFYKRCIETGSIKGEVANWVIRAGAGGLCLSSIRHRRTFKLFGNNKSNYWGYGKGYGRISCKVMYDFTPLRQTIVLLCAALNNEL